MLEAQAHRFAGALLLPAEAIAAEVRIPPTLDDLLILKRRWGVSAAAIIMRLHAIDLIDDEQKLSLFKRRSVRWGAKSEPGDDERPPEQPRLLRRTIDLLIEENVMPRDSIAKHVGLSEVDVEMIAGLPRGFLTGKTNLVHFAKLKTKSSATAEPAIGGSVLIPFRSSNQR
jgi:hypothetical protein